MDNAALPHDVVIRAARILVNRAGLLIDSRLVNAVEEKSIVSGCREGARARVRAPAPLLRSFGVRRARPGREGDLGRGSSGAGCGWDGLSGASLGSAGEQNSLPSGTEPEPEPEPPRCSAVPRLGYLTN